MPLVRALLAVTLPGFLLCALPDVARGADAAGDTDTAVSDAHAFADIATLQATMAAGEVDALTLTRLFITRIARLDHAGPRVNSVSELNPEAQALARANDAARAAGAHGLLQGIPVLLKDNIDTGDRMRTTAGSFALADAPAARDATVAARLRDAGAVLLGKANLSEWANFRSTRATSGWSAVGGLTRNPWVLDRNACGSSSGSAAAVAAGFTVVAIGTETDGSILCPAAMNGVVGIKPTLGLVSRAGVVPISHNQDTPGALARTVGDAATLLTVLAGSDPRDPATAEADAHAGDYRKFLTADGLRGKRIGVVRDYAGEPHADRALARAMAALEAGGAVLVDPVSLPHATDLGADEMTVLLHDFKHDIAAYLATRAGIKARTLADLVAFNKAHARAEMPWFGQELFELAEATSGLSDPQYLEARERVQRRAGAEGIDAALREHEVDALLAPAWSPAFRTDLVLGDHIVSGHAQGGSPAQLPAVAGYPAIAVPADFAAGLPVGVVLLGPRWSEGTLITIAHGLEQQLALAARPRFLPTIEVAVPAPDPSGTRAAGLFRD